MSVNRSKGDHQLSNISFEQHQKIANNHQELKHKKKASEHKKTVKALHCIRLKTDEREPLNLFKNQALHPSTISVSQTFSNSKKSKSKHKPIACDKSAKVKKNKHFVSIVEQGKNTQQFKTRLSPTVTKRKQTMSDLGHIIESKVQDFQILSNCFQEYIKQQRKNNGVVNTLDILKIISAFNRSEISPICKPLQALINNIIKSIQLSLPPPEHIKSILKKSISFESPSKALTSNQETGTVKKSVNTKQVKNKVSHATGNLETLQQNLGKLKYESNRLKYFLQQISLKGRQSRKRCDDKVVDREKVEELIRLRERTEDQVPINQQLQNSPEHSADTFRQE